jgi:hypothetical protein
MIRCTKTSALLLPRRLHHRQGTLIFRALRSRLHPSHQKMSSARIVAGLSSAVVRLSTLTFLRWVRYDDV